MAVLEDVIRRAKEVLASYEVRPEIREVGELIEVQDGVALVKGLRKASMGEFLLIAGKVPGQVFNLEKDYLRCVILGDYTVLRTGDPVFRSEGTVQVPVGKELLGRIVDPLGNPLDGGSTLRTRWRRSIFAPAPQIIDRTPVHRPLLTGVKMIDSMIPLGKGQRELIIGDRRTGKTSLVLDAIINQRGKNVICVYAGIGQELSKIVQVVETLKSFEAFSYTVIVATSSEDPPALIYVTPYAACTIGEYFMYQGEDVLVVYDDLTKHASAYRSIALLMRRPPGRESYPGEIFYIHSSLLERSAQLSEHMGGGSMSALPIVETQEGDISAYIPTNIISITDGQIYLESSLFAKGFLPAVNIGLSVSRVGSEAQTLIMKSVAKRLRLDLSQYFELEDFARFSSDLDENTQKQLEHGRKVLQLLTQPQSAPLPLGLEIVGIFSATQGLVDPVPLERIKDWEFGLYAYLEEKAKPLLESLEKDSVWSLDLEKELREVIIQFTQQFLGE
ncbi:MAG: F0F1 ATP synthase subunit alpha [Candidatus Caldatribacteriaceae bacterium]